MLKKKRTKLKGKQLLNRLTGISTPVGGVSWTPPIEEQDIARKLLVFLEDRRVLYMPFNMEIGPYVIESIQKIRNRLTIDLQKISKSAVLGESISAMRTSCRKFMTETQFKERNRGIWHIEGRIWNALRELRAIFGIHIARIACAYDLEVEEQLESIFPLEGEKEE